MKAQQVTFAGIPAVIFGAPSNHVFLFLHGKNGSKDEAAAFAEVVCQLGVCVIGVDLPEHGARVGDGSHLVPWQVVPELQALLTVLKKQYRQVFIRANSIGAWFSMLAGQKVPIDGCLFVSPILDMDRLIVKMLSWAGADEARLQAAGEIATDFGETLSWEYLTYVRAHPIAVWPAATSILFAGKDHLTDRADAEQFAARHGCELMVMENGEHWFHTDEQLAVLRAWEYRTALRLLS